MVVEEEGLEIRQEKNMTKKTMLKCSRTGLHVLKEQKALLTSSFLFSFKV